MQSSQGNDFSLLQLNREVPSSIVQDFQSKIQLKATCTTCWTWRPLMLSYACLSLWVWGGCNVLASLLQHLEKCARSKDTYARLISFCLQIKHTFLLVILLVFKYCVIKSWDDILESNVHVNSHFLLLLKMSRDTLNMKVYVGWKFVKHSHWL